MARRRDDRHRQPIWATHFLMLLTQMDTIAACLQQLIIHLRNPVSSQYASLNTMVKEWEQQSKADKLLTFEAVAVARSLTALDYTLSELTATMKTVREQLTKQGMMLRDK